MDGQTGLTDADLVDLLRRSGAVPEFDVRDLVRFPICYTAKFWKLETPAKTYIIKEFFPGLEDNPLYPTVPDQEAASLTRLQPHQVTPDLEAFLTTPAGDPLLLYSYQPKAGVELDVQEAADVIARFHRLEIPLGGFRQRPATAGEALCHGEEILALIPESRKAVNLRKLKPDVPDAGKAAPRLVHSSLSLGTLISTAAGLRLIDWQYAGLGDPVEDLCCFLSPGLQSLYGARPPALEAEEMFLNAYPDKETVARFETVREAYHWRMAAYCLYREETLAVSNPPASRAYSRSLEADVDLLLRLRGR